MAAVDQRGAAMRRRVINLLTFLLPVLVIAVVVHDHGQAPRAAAELDR